MQRFIPLLSVSVLLLLNSCKLFDPHEQESDPVIVFEFNHTNWAWGYTNHGFYIDAAANVYSYRWGIDEGHWNHNDSDTITHVELIEKYNKQKTFIDSVDIEELYEMHLLIDAAAKGNYSDRMNTGADGGAFTYLAYQYLTPGREYIPVMLKQVGDWSYENLSAEAAEIVVWLNGQELSQDQLFFNWPELP